jgi:hypothetical protein
MSAISIEPDRGAISIEGCAGALYGGLELAAARSLLAPFIGDESAWLDYNRLQTIGFSFGGWLCDLSITFHFGGFMMANWQISKARPSDASRWLSQAEIDEQLMVLRETLYAQLGRPFDGRFESFFWGRIWCGLELHTEYPAAELRYEVGAEDQLVN